MKKNLEQIFAQNPSWSKVCDILNKCHKHGFFSVIAGGAVRDALLGKVPKDFDIATEAHPDQLIPIFQKSKKVGKSFGVLLLPIGHEQHVEIATFRTDGSYKDGRRPESVTFCSINEDAVRRDFTINALYYDIQKHEVIDYVQGVSDIQDRIIRTVGLPEKRFQEDKLRLLRALRFSLAFDFNIEKQTYLAIQKHMPDISILAKERVLDEMKKIFRTGKLKETLKVFNDAHFFQSLWPHWKYPSEEDRHMWAQAPFDNKSELYWWIFILTPFVMTENSFLKQTNPSFVKSFQTLKNTLIAYLKKMDLYKNIRLPKELIQDITNFYLFYLEMTSTATDSTLNLGKKLYLLKKNFHYLELLKTLTFQKTSLQKAVQSVESVWNEKFLNAKVPEPLLKGEDLEALPVDKKLRSPLMKYIYARQLLEPALTKQEALKLASSVSPDVLIYFERI